MDIIYDENYIRKLEEFQRIVNPKPYTSEELQEIIKKKTEERNKRCEIKKVM